MYLGPALRLAIPLAIKDRIDMVQAFGGVGPDAQAARSACRDLRAVVGVSPARFTPSQRETARLALLWGEQYLEGYIDAIGASNPSELKLARKQRQQIRKVRLEHFGKTAMEAMSERAVKVDAMEYLRGAAATKGKP